MEHEGAAVGSDDLWTADASQEESAGVSWVILKRKMEITMPDSVLVALIPPSGRARLPRDGAL